MSLDTTQLWHARAKPWPIEEDFNAQLGCHIEEFVEMLDTLAVLGHNTNSGFDLLHAVDALDHLSAGLKSGETKMHITNRKEFLDSLADQVVTAVGAGYRAGMDVPQAVDRVNTSNWSKFDEHGQPIFDENGKIAKGPNYKPVDLTGLY
jgi:predicted HAD superfamily Cof-like phosphohydrolase